MVRAMFQKLKLHEQFHMVNNNFVRLQPFCTCLYFMLPRFSKVASVLHRIASIGTLYC